MLIAYNDLDTKCCAQVDHCYWTDTEPECSYNIGVFITTSGLCLKFIMTKEEYNKVAEELYKIGKSCIPNECTILE